MSSEPQSLQCLACHSAAALTRSNTTKTNPSQAPQGAIAMPKQPGTARLNAMRMGDDTAAWPKACPRSEWVYTGIGAAQKRKPQGL